MIYAILWPFELKRQPRTIVPKTDHRIFSLFDVCNTERPSQQQLSSCYSQ